MDGVHSIAWQDEPEPTNVLSGPCATALAGHSSCYLGLGTPPAPPNENGGQLNFELWARRESRRRQSARLLACCALPDENTGDSPVASLPKTRRYSFCPCDVHAPWRFATTTGTTVEVSAVKRPSVSPALLLGIRDRAWTPSAQCPAGKGFPAPCCTWKQKDD